MLFGERFAGREHVAVHLLDPCDEAVEIARPTRLAHAMDRHAGELVDARLTGCGVSPTPRVSTSTATP